MVWPVRVDGRLRGGVQVRFNREGAKKAASGNVLPRWIGEGGGALPFWTAASALRKTSRPFGSRSNPVSVGRASYSPHPGVSRSSARRASVILPPRARQILGAWRARSGKLPRAPGVSRRRGLRHRLDDFSARRGRARASRMTSPQSGPRGPGSAAACRLDRLGRGERLAEQPAFARSSYFPRQVGDPRLQLNAGATSLTSGLLRELSTSRRALLPRGHLMFGLLAVWASSRRRGARRGKAARPRGQRGHERQALSGTASAPPGGSRVRRLNFK